MSKLLLSDASKPFLLARSSFFRRSSSRFNFSCSFFNLSNSRSFAFSDFCVPLSALLSFCTAEFGAVGVDCESGVAGLPGENATFLQGKPNSSNELSNFRFRPSLMVWSMLMTLSRSSIGDGIPSTERSRTPESVGPVRCQQIKTLQYLGMVLTGTDRVSGSYRAGLGERRDC